MDKFTKKELCAMSDEEFEEKFEGVDTYDFKEDKYYISDYEDDDIFVVLEVINPENEQHLALKLLSENEANYENFMAEITKTTQYHSWKSKLTELINSLDSDLDRLDDSYLEDYAFESLDDEEKERLAQYRAEVIDYKAEFKRNLIEFINSANLLPNAKKDLLNSVEFLLVENFDLDILDNIYIELQSSIENNWLS